MHDELRAAGRVEPHKWAPDSGWSSHYIRTVEDVDAVIELLRMNYERATRRTAERAAG